MLQGGTIGLVSVAKIRIIPKFEYILEYQNVLVFNNAQIQSENDCGMS